MFLTVTATMLLQQCCSNKTMLQQQMLPIVYEGLRTGINTVPHDIYIYTVGGCFVMMVYIAQWKYRAGILHGVCS